MNINRGEVWIVRLDPVEGHEQGKARPCVVISRNSMNTTGLSIIVPFTSKPFHVKTGKLHPAMTEVLPPDGGLTKPSYSMAYQVRTVSRSRFGKQIGALSAETLDAIVQTVHSLIEE